MLVLSASTVRGLRRGLWPESLLHFAKIEADQSVCEKHGRNAAGSSEAVNGRFTDLQHFGELARGQVFSSLVPGLFRRIDFAGLRVVFLSLGCHLFLHRLE